MSAITTIKTITAKTITEFSEQVERDETFVKSGEIRVSWFNPTTNTTSAHFIRKTSGNEKARTHCEKCCGDYLKLMETIAKLFKSVEERCNVFRKACVAIAKEIGGANIKEEEVFKILESCEKEKLLKLINTVGIAAVNALSGHSNQ